jgi:uncharacterized protein with FMN-binding domain
MNLNAGKAYRARLGFAGLAGTVVVLVGGKALAAHGDEPTALVRPAGMPGAEQSAKPAPATGGAGAAPTPNVGATPSGSAAAATPSPAAVPSRPPTPRTVVGDAIDTKYGPVQVQLVVVGDKITDVVAVVLPNRLWRDIQINNSAVPVLRQRVLDIQSAKIDVVSGASYTSSGYAWSVQSAIDKAGLG